MEGYGEVGGRTVLGCRLPKSEPGLYGAGGVKEG